MSIALALIFIGFDLAWSGIHNEGPFDEILRAFRAGGDLGQGVQGLGQGAGAALSGAATATTTGLTGYSPSQAIPGGIPAFGGIFTFLGGGA